MRSQIKSLCSLLLLVIILTACGPTAAPTPSAEPVATGAPTVAVEPTPPPAPTTIPTAPPTATPPPTPVSPSPQPTVGGPVAVTPPPASARFAPYPKEPVTVEPNVSHEPIAPDLANVVNTFLLSSPQEEHLAQNGFVVSPSQEKEFYMLYERARYNLEPIFVTSDSLLHAYHLLFDKVLRSLEREQFIPIAKELNAEMLASTQTQYETLKGTALEEHARRNVAFFGVASRLLDPDVVIPPYAADLVEAEIDLIMAHEGLRPSPLFPGLPYGEDYTQYIPRGHYTMGEDLEAYFRAWMWYGRMTFRLFNPDETPNLEETRRALLIVQAMALNPQATALWQAIYEPTVFFVGRSDDLLYTEYIEAVNDVYGGVPQDPLAFADQDDLTAFMERAEKLRPPRILGMVIGPVADEGKATKGFRFMGQRFIPDSYIHGLLIDTKVPYRFPPKGLDILAVFGSERAYQILEQEGDTAMPNYAETVADLQEEFAAYTEDDWTQNLYWSWLYQFFPLLEEPGEGYPDFMRSQAWLDKSLNTVLGSWAELRHDTILYAKQAYAELGGAPSPPPPEPPKGYVEPVPEFYARLAALAAMTRQGLEARGLVPERAAGHSELTVALDALDTLRALALRLKAIAEIELAGQPLDKATYNEIRFYGGTLEHLTFAAADSEQPGGEPAAEEEPQAAVIADVATHPALQQVLEVGVGRIFDIYVVVPIEGELVVAKGGVFSYYEFPWPMDDRLTDEKWRAMLDSGEAPEPPGWTSTFRTDETANEALREAVLNFNKSWIDAAWYVEPGYLDAVAVGEALERNVAYIESLAEQELMEGHHLIRLLVLSYDLQDDDHAVVTTEETWDTERYQTPYPGEPGELVATRPEHTIGVIYHLERIEGRWLVSEVSIEGSMPAWEEVP